MGGNEQNIVERQRFLQNTHGLSLNAKQNYTRALHPAQTSEHIPAHLVVIYQEASNV